MNGHVAADVRLAIRGFLRDRGVTIVALASLAIGIAANTTIFSLVQAVEFPPLIYPDASRIVFIESRDDSRDLPGLLVSAPDARDLAAATSTLITPALTGDQSATILEAAAPARFSGRQVDAAFFDVMRTPALHGRVLTPADGADAIVLSEPFWRVQLGGDPSVVGRVVHVDDEPRTVVGVMPPKFDRDADFWIPLPTAVSAAGRNDRQYTTFARLAPGVSIERAAAELDAISARLAASHPDTNRQWRLYPTLLRRMHGEDARGTFFALQAAVAFVLLIACANIANLMLARGTRRRHEMAVRVALGASRRRLLQQLLTESLLLAGAGGVIGALLALWGLRLARALGPFLDAVDPQINVGTLAFTAVVSVVTGLVCGVMPAIQASRVAPQTTMRADGGRGATPGRHRLRAGLVALQIAAAMMLATSAALMAQTMANRSRVALGFDPSGAVQASLAFAGPRYRDLRVADRALTATLDAIAARPGIEAAGAMAWTLSNGTSAAREIGVPSHGAGPAAGAPRAVEAATPGYFAALGVPVIRGRVFTPADRAGAPPVAVINEAFASNAWGNADPIGDTVRLGPASDPASPLVTVVGVVGSTRRSVMHGSVAPRVYVPFSQFPSAEVELIARGHDSTSVAMSAMQDAVRGVDRTLVLDNQRTVSADLAQFVEPMRFITSLAAAFGVAGLLLAALGIFGMMSYVVSEQQRDLAVRAALGATRADIIRLVLRSAAAMTIAGLLPGIAGALAAGRAIGSQLYGVSASDPLTFVSVALLLAAVALVACYRPARAAAAADPMTVLRRD